MGKKTVAYTAPFLTFMLFIGMSQALDAAHFAPGGFRSVYLIFPIQTIVCAVVLAIFWPAYHLAPPRKAWLALAIGALLFALWVFSSLLLEKVLHRPPRLDGFDPTLFAGRPSLYWTELVMRFLRLVLVVPLLEEIFWRGFLLRYFINEDFDTIPFGTYARTANAVIAAGFMFEHSTQDWPAALAAGLLYNMVAYRSRSLSSCVLAHAVTNALLGAYIMQTRQWGFW